LRTVALIVLILSAGCGPKASPESPVAQAATAPVPQLVTLAPGTDPARLDELVPLGARVPDEPHLIGDDYVLLAPVERVDAIRGVDFVRAVAPLPPERRADRDRLPATGRTSVVIDLFAGADAAAVADVITRWGGQVTATLAATVRAQIPAERLDELLARPDVRWIEPAP
jgi:hypothetical protein